MIIFKIAVSFVIGFAVSYFILSLSIHRDEAVLGEQQENNIEITQNTEVANTPTPAPSPKIIPTPSVTPIPPPTSTPAPTAIPTPIVSPPDIEHFFVQYSEHYGVDEQLLKKIAHCESRFNPNAQNAIYLGLFQFNETSWNTLRTEMGHDINPDLRLNAEESIKTAAYALSVGRSHLWRNCR